MVSSHDLFSHQHSTTSMAKPRTGRAPVCLTDGCLYLGGALLALLLVWAFWSSFIPSSDFELSIGDKFRNPANYAGAPMAGIRTSDPDGPTFYDDPELSYSIEKPINGWDEKRKEWLKLHPSFAAGAAERILMVTGSQPSPCKNPIGDHLLLRFFKNKVDYCRIHGYEIFYNNALLHPKMKSFWAKLPVVKAAMLAHPEAEWIWWVDSDALFTDMDFKVPLHRYRNHNLVVHGWQREIYERTSWTALNAGVFLIRNSQWSMDLIDVWAKMGPIGPDYNKWGSVQRSIFKDKLYPESDDQTALIYLLYKYRDKYYDHIYLEGEYFFESYWLQVVKKYDNVTEHYLEIERGERKLRRRHAEAVSEQYAEFREEFLNRGKDPTRSSARPFVTHFTGCQPCSGDHNQMYTGESCWNSMVRALNFADNQVLRKFGFGHSDLRVTSPVTELPFDYPSEEGPW